MDAKRPESPAAASLPTELLALARELRAEGVALGTAELLDAFAALQQISWEQEADFRSALGATLAKSQEDRHTFDLVYERFMLRRTALAASRDRAADARADAEEGSGAPDGRSRTVLEQLFGSEELSEGELQALRAALVQILSSAGQGPHATESQLRDLARYTVLALGAGAGSGVLGVDLQRIRRTLDLRSEDRPSLPTDDPRRHGVPRAALRRFEALLRRELEAAQIERTGALPPARALRELSRALPSSPLRDLASVQRTIAQLRRALATHSHEARGARTRAHVDIRRTMRASLQSGGVPIVLKERPQRPRRPEIYVVCDVSTSVTSASVFFLSVLHALHDAFRRIRSFLFIERVSEVTDIFEAERDFRALSERLTKHAGVADISGYTDYGRVWSQLRTMIEDDLDRRCTLIILGDARSNGRDPGSADFARLAAHAGRTFWLNPEPRLYWNYGDSVMASYEPYCIPFECWTAAQLEQVVRALARPDSALAS
ncbi:MAG TPA: VWA domain-containing protein [Solirubrobacteraceae bacterium]|nr:VWA domain-containing protein [Solirubrobacteraceae bacterium]